MLAKMTSKNQLTLPRRITDAVGSPQYFEVEVRDGTIVLTPVRILAADAVRAKLATSEVHARWQTMMRDYLDTDVSATQGGQPIEMLEQVFLLE